MDQYNILYITIGSSSQAEQIAHTLIEEKLAACVNILGPVVSIYRYQGKTNQDTETVMIAKTLSSKVDRVIERIKELHPYECPCIIALPIIKGNPDFLNWIAEEVTSL